MKRFLFLLLLSVAAASVSAYHDDYGPYGYGYGGYGYDGYGYDGRYGGYYNHYYDDPIYVDYDGLGRYGGYRCIGSGCYAVDYLHAGWGYGGYGGCRAYYCNDRWNEDYEYLSRGRYAIGNSYYW